jgi:hypothetical protein
MRLAEPSQAGPTERLRTGTYLTDGTRLFRVASVTLGSKGPEVVELEDCHTLEASVHDRRAFAKLELVAVRPAGDV